jgi:ABC-type lipoprotein export system ATPase subunit
MAAGGDQIIIVDDVDQEFESGGQTIKPLQKVTFSIHKNSFNIIYGPSGSGKSTLLNVLTGLQQPTRGKVTIDDRDIYNMSPDELANFRANHLGFVYQTNFWIKSLNVLDNVAMSLYFLGHTRQSAAKLAHESLALIHMEDYAKKYPALLSGGEQQRIAMARALATSPSFIIADEPTGALDSKSGEMIMDLLKYCQQQLHRTIILVTHNMEYLPLADQLLRIEDGHVEGMRSDSITETTNQLLREMQQRISRLAKSRKAL